MVNILYHALQIPFERVMGWSENKLFFSNRTNEISWYTLYHCLYTIYFRYRDHAERFKLSILISYFKILEIEGDWLQQNIDSNPMLQASEVRGTTHGGKKFLILFSIKKCEWLQISSSTKDTIMLFEFLIVFFLTVYTFEANNHDVCSVRMMNTIPFFLFLVNVLNFLN